MTHAMNVAANGRVYQRSECAIFFLHRLTTATDQQPPNHHPNTRCPSVTDNDRDADAPRFKLCLVLLVLCSVDDDDGVETGF
ncbi:hypothetical protein EVAR_69220_1 [Eumeta japonica]|uniref:Uncharacterized protein n=1 Tax=Eumeta variegata TaxID=151549 RepID=A0A4C1SNL3_EUMVA|nr:hypothetical protein EVAR_69220_1 [Eumeta japonica]